MGNICGKSRPRPQQQQERQESHEYQGSHERLGAGATTYPPPTETRRTSGNIPAPAVRSTQEPSSYVTNPEPLIHEGAKGKVRFQDMQRDRLRSSKSNGYYQKTDRGSPYRSDDMGASAAILSAMQLNTAAYSNDSCVSSGWGSGPSCNTTSCDSGVSCSSDAGASSSCNM
jgi:hypothetical protein